MTLLQGFPFIQNFPFITIVLSLFTAALSFALPKRAAKAASILLLILSGLMSLATLLFNLADETGYFVYRMGHYDAPIGNEIAAGLLEPFFALLFETVLLLSVIGGSKRIREDVDEKKQHFYFIMIDLVHVALVALAYTNDIFTGYVFVEICTLASCALLMIRNLGHSLVAATRYMIFSLIGSGLFLLGVILLYSITGHLLFPQLYASVQELFASGEYHIPLTVAIGLVVSGLAIKSGLFPFHLWMPDTYASATPASSSILSGVVSKGYLFLLLKVVFRAIGNDVFYASGVQYVLFTFGIAGMILGSVSAIRTRKLCYMIAFSSAAQIGYIYMGIGLGTRAALVAALFQIVAHALTKPMLFLSAAGLRETADHSQIFKDLLGSAHKNRAAGFVFTVGTMSMIGIPMLAGFVPKLLFSLAAFGNGIETYAVLLALAVSTILNVAYFLRTVLTIRSRAHTRELTEIPAQTNRAFVAVGILLTLLNVTIGLHSQPLINLFERGIELFISVR